MNNSTVNIVDLCEEMLLTIFNKLNNIDVLYSLIGVNKKFDRLARDINFTQSFDFTTMLSNEDDSSKTNSMLNRFSCHIIPRIQHNIQCVTLDSRSMDSVLSIRNFSKLHKLTLLNLKVEMAYRIFYSESSFVPIIKNQISHLIVMIDGTTGNEYRWCLCRSIFARICTEFTNLTHFHFDLKNRRRKILQPLIGLKSKCYSSSIIHLNIKVRIFDDCLWLLDGHLSQLHSLIVHVEHIENTSWVINNTKIVSNLKCFSLISFSITLEYDNQILPLLSQMSKLEKLTLSLYVRGRTSFIDGTHLDNDIISKMPYLHTFIFDIVTEHVRIDKEHLPTSDHVRRALIEKGYNVGCYIDYLLNEGGRCHIYSLPFIMECMNAITIQFLPDGAFTHVRKLCLYDPMRSIEHDFFILISQTFPLLEYLTVLSMMNQNKLDEDEQKFSIIEYSHLMTLDLIMSHVDYAKQFLLNTNTRLPRLSTLAITYENLVNVTEDFTSDAAHANCSNLKNIFFPEWPRIFGANFSTYFPLVINKDKYPF